ncbi:YlbG family protein [Pueribacillus sp. YX66]|uniref:YlbG family protein n=1 Tax=Pueribacillus sp. YX66 TaxID=3229242 RepID=UPI00358D4312
MINERVGLSVWLYSLKHTRNLRRFGHVIYVSRKMKYVILYCSKEDLEQTVEKLNSFSFVKLVQPSFRPYLKTEYEKVRNDKEKEYELKIGF